MINYTKKDINILTFIISILIFLFINSFFQIVESKSFNQDFSQSEETVAEVTETPTTEIIDVPKKTEKVEEKKEWTLKIPVINLEAPISEGTNSENLNKFVGHFEDTDMFDGNIGLAAHNRGYPVNYFQNIKRLKKGDEVYYKYNGKERMYVIDKIEVIKDTDWTNLQKTNENKITLITCVEDAPMYRRCVQGTQKGSE